MTRTRVFLVDDHAMILEAFERLLEEECDIVGTARDGAEFLAKAPAARPQVVVMDIGMPKLNGIDAARRLLDLLPDVRIVFLTTSEDPDIAADALATAAGAGFLLKNGAGSELLKAIREASRGRTYVTPRIAKAVFSSARIRSGPRLTPRQREVLQLLAEGKSMKQVAYALGITARTVAHHKYTMMDVLGFENSAELIRYAERRGISH
jgi:DNA-binding NarL/FixJ family response regulator